MGTSVSPPKPALTLILKIRPPTQCDNETLSDSCGKVIKSGLCCIPVFAPVVFDRPASGST
jgi:hypothetical protein